MPSVLRPQFEQQMREIQRGSPLGPAAVAAYRQKILDLIESVPDILVNKASVTGHPEMRLDYRCTWLGPNWEQVEISKTMLHAFPGSVFPEGASETHISEFEDEAVLFRFGAVLPEGYLTGRIRILPS